MCRSGRINKRYENKINVYIKLYDRRNWLQKIYIFEKTNDYGQHCYIDDNAYAINKIAEYT